MHRETKAAKEARAQEIEERLYAHVGAGETELHFSDPFTLTVAVVLSAQATDKGVNKVTPILFERFPTPKDLAEAPLEVIEEIVHPLGFYHNKAKNIKALAHELVAHFDAEVPRDFDALQTLPGVGRKTANCVMAAAFHEAHGIAVDTHVFRIAHRLKLAPSSANSPEKVEQVLMQLYTPEQWLDINHQLVWFGRNYCTAKNPKCKTCFLCDLCPSAVL